MPDIKILDSLTASKIAAGEVVDRPFNVVKELVENAVDAGALKITVDISDGGGSSITVSDDGEGITYDELALAVRRFATSKTRVVEDVYNVSTYGFRGEALAAISAVSAFKLLSVTEGAQAGEISVEYGVISAPKPAALSKGTHISVSNLFDNLPVRKKFLKSKRSNEGEILKFLKHFAMLNPGVELVVIFDGKEVYRTYPADKTLDLVKSVFKEDRVMQAEVDAGGIKISVCTTHPEVQKARRDNIYIGVNGRVVKDPALVQAVIQAYHRLIPANAYPASLVDVRVDPSFVDVNIHPTKSEVRFDSENASGIFGLVVKAVKKALEKFTSAVYAEAEEEINQDMVEQPKLTVSKVEMTKQQREDPFLKTAPPAANSFTNQIAKESTAAYKASPAVDLTKELEPARAFYKKEDTARAVEKMLSEAVEYKVIGQLNNMYIVCQSPRGDLVVIDQHVAHERVLYEKYLAERMNTTPSITLFEPVVVALEDDELDMLQEIEEEMARFGYAYEAFGPKEIKVTRVPVDKLKKDAAAEFSSIVHDAMEHRKSRSADYAVVTMSCRNAVKAGDSLSHYEMQHLVDTLFTVDNYHTCPHGRPIIYTMQSAELDRKFQR